MDTMLELCRAAGLQRGADYRLAPFPYGAIPTEVGERKLLDRAAVDQTFSARLDAASRYVVRQVLNHDDTLPSPIRRRGSALLGRDRR